MSLSVFCPTMPPIQNGAVIQFQTHTLSMKIHTLTDIQFVMVSKDSNQTLAGAKLKITSASQPQVRRRYRNPWSLF